MPAEKKIVAFLQNPWFRPGIHPLHVAMYRDDQEFHRRVLSLSATGRALEKAFGSELYRRIHWDNANPAHGATRDAKFPPDMEHMLTTIVLQNPDVIMLFGQQAHTGWLKLLDVAKCKEVTEEEFLNGRTILRSAHPMARGSAARHLEKIVRDLKMLIS